MYIYRQTLLFVGPLILLSVFIVPILSRSVTFSEIRAKFNPNYISNFSSYSENNTIYMDIFVNRTLGYGFKTFLEFQLRLKNSNKYQTLFSHNIDVCGMIVSFRESIFKRWYGTFLKYGNFMDNCPVPVGHYYLKAWHMDISLIPAYLYDGDYRIKGHGYYGKYKSKKEEFVIDGEFDITMY